MIDQDFCCQKSLNYRRAMELPKIFCEPLEVNARHGRGGVNAFGYHGSLELYHLLHDLPPILGDANLLWSRTAFNTREIAKQIGQDYLARWQQKCERLGQIPPEIQK